MSAREELITIYNQRGAHSVDFPDGWIPLLDELNTAMALRDPSYKISQVKVKFGGLRVHYGSAVPMRDLVERTEQATAVTCETCSGPGVMRSGYWTLCDAHSEGRAPIGD